jgi:hypothetical protein
LDSDFALVALGVYFPLDYMIYQQNSTETSFLLFHHSWGKFLAKHLAVLDNLVQQLILNYQNTQNQTQTMHEMIVSLASVGFLSVQELGAHPI